jgi:hypothetical protein
MNSKQCSDKCPICYDCCIDNDKFITTTCGYLFHNLCLQKWFEKEQTCPICRTLINTELDELLSFYTNNNFNFGLLCKVTQNHGYKFKINEIQFDVTLHKIDDFIINYCKTNNNKLNIFYKQQLYK